LQLADAFLKIRTRSFLSKIYRTTP